MNRIKVAFVAVIFGVVLGLWSEPLGVDTRKLDFR